MTDDYRIEVETMREVQPYRTERGLLKILDNGGRFFNIFTRAGDDQITRAELAKAAGTFGSAPKAALFFEMAYANATRFRKCFWREKYQSDSLSPAKKQHVERAIGQSPTLRSFGLAA